MRVVSRFLGMGAVFTTGPRPPFTIGPRPVGVDHPEHHPPFTFGPQPLAVDQ